MTDYRLVFNGQLNQSSANALRHRVADALGQEDFERLTIVFSSEGGSTREGLALYNFIRELPAPVDIHAAGHVGSAAVSVFLAGRKRTCTPLSRFFFHSFQWTFGDSPQSVAQIDEAMKRIVNDAELARRIVSRHTKVPPKVLGTLFGAGAVPTIADPARAIEWGIVEAIEELNPDGASQPDTKIWTVGWQ
jgi:ATP-dependent Clp protease, protease subunit